MLLKDSSSSLVYTERELSEMQEEFDV